MKLILAITLLVISNISFGSNISDARFESQIFQSKKTLFIALQCQLDDNEIKEKWDKALGTFQFEILSRRDSRELFTFKMEVIHKIEANRHETDIVYISYNDFVRIKILPKNQISGAFQKLELMKEVDSFE